MAGIAVADLDGCVIPAQVFTGWDHTYVTSSCGLTWGCFGRFLGGSTLCSGIGSSIIADCLSQPNATAGIRYLGTGVCHQAANRILDSASVTVSGAKGYAWSTAAWGVYGPNFGAARLLCYPPGTRIARGHASHPLQGDNVTAKQAYDHEVHEASHGSIDDEQQRLAELAALVKLGLGRPLDASVFQALAVIQRRMRQGQRELLASLDSESINPETYLDLLTALHHRTQKAYLRVLGDEAFDAIFGEGGRHPEGMIEREVFLDQERKPLYR
jgi:hypothetical protein